MNPRRNDDDNTDDVPPYSRVFVVLGKDVSPDEVRTAFEKYGEITNIKMPKDRDTGESRGVAFIKYEKTSSAAAAIEGLHKQTLGPSKKHVKVMIAASKNDQNEVDADKINRLFIKIPKEATAEEIKEHFSQFGQVSSVSIQKDRQTQESKGLAYVQFSSFLETAKAFEKCEIKYKPVFATPKEDRELYKRNRDGHDVFNGNFNMPMNNAPFNDFHPSFSRANSVPINTPPQRQLGYRTVIGTCSPIVPEICIEKLFNIVPGMKEFHYQIDRGCCRAVVMYEDERQAAHAVDRLNNYEFPSREILHVKPDSPLTKVANDLTSMITNFKNAVDNGSPDVAQLAEAIAQASSLIKQATTGGRIPAQQKPGMMRQDLNLGDMGSDNMGTDFTNVALPRQQPLAPPSAKVAQRCFIVCKPHPPPNHILMNIFSRFGNLIDVSTIPNKTFGFARYAKEQSAQDAIATLHGAVVFGTLLKVVEADNRRSKDNDMDHDGDRKRMKLDSRDSD